MLLNAALCVWNEADIIESTVRHAFAQGCANVFVVDNASTDKTVDVAISAGAQVAGIFATKDFNEDQKVAHLNATVNAVNAMTPEEKIWWLYIDADEFPNFDNRFTLLDILKHLDSSIRAIQGYMFDHIPTHQPYHVQGYHPADFQPLCMKTAGSKIPLLRYDKGHPHLWSIGGAHDFITHGEDIAILKDFLQIHHFPYRNPEFTLPRTKKLAQSRNAWYKKFLHQVHASDTSAYEARYKQLKAMYDQNKNLELKMNTLVYDYSNIVRWYDRYTEKKLPCSDLEKYIATAIYYFFLEEYDIALCRFNDALIVCDDDSIKLWLLIKIAECFLFTGNAEADTIISSVKKYNDTEIHAYIDACFAGKRRKQAASRADMIRKVEWYTSVLPADIEEKYRLMTAGIEKTLFK